MWKVISESMSTVEMDMNDSVQVSPVGGSSAAASARSLLYFTPLQIVHKKAEFWWMVGVLLTTSPYHTLCVGIWFCCSSSTQLFSGTVDHSGN